MKISINKISISNPAFVGRFNYSNEPGFTYANGDLYPFDYNNDGLQEIIFSAFETQYNTPENFTNSRISIFGWIDGELKDITSKLLLGEGVNVEGTGDVAFGDFNGDSLVDAYLSANADMNYLLHSYELINKGTYFEKIKLDKAMWEHGVAVGDLNKDGFDDVVTVGYSEMNLYFGSPSGLLKSNLSSLMGSGVAIADFLNDKTQTVIVTDSPSSDESDTKLFAIEYDENNNPIRWNLISTLPPPRLASASLKQELYGGALVQFPGSHGVRAEPLDFSGDGMVDVLIFENGSSGGFQGSQIQFLENIGDGIFEDVTDSFLIGYPLKSQIAYNPVQVDINNDNEMDLYVSVDKGNSAFLISNSNDTYSDRFRFEIDNSLVDSSARSTVVTGPNNQLFLVQEYRQYGGMSDIYYSNVHFDSLYQGDSLSNEIKGGVGNDTIYGGPGDDKIDGNLGDDVLVGNSGNDSIDGAGGSDRVIFSGAKKDYLISFSKNNHQFSFYSDLEGDDEIDNVELYEFNDGIYPADELISFNLAASFKTWRGSSMAGSKIMQYGQGVVKDDDFFILSGIKDKDPILDGIVIIEPIVEAPQNPAGSSITLGDVLAALKIYLGKPLSDAYASPYNYIAADFDGNGSVNLTDVLSLLKFYLGKTTTATPSWVFVDSADVTGTGKTASILRAGSDSLPIDVTHTQPHAIDQDFSKDSSIELVGVLRGDVDGSWTAGK